MRAVTLSDLAMPMWDGTDAQGTRRLEFDPFVPPTSITPIGDIAPGSRIAVAGRLADVVCRQWTGGPVLEATLTDGGWSVVLAFFGRRAIGGVDEGRTLIAGGTVLRRLGRRYILNPHIWLTPGSGTSATDPSHRPRR